jgi:formylmethanofuran dehydrogenase subunit E
MSYHTKFIVALLLISIPMGMVVFGISSLQSEQPKVSVSLSPAKSPNGQMSMMVSDEVRHQLLLLSNYGIFDWIECEINADRSATLRGQVRCRKCPEEY